MKKVSQRRAHIRNTETNVRRHSVVREVSALGIGVPFPPKAKIKMISGAPKPKYPNLMHIPKPEAERRHDLLKKHIRLMAKPHYPKPKPIIFKKFNPTGAI